MKRGELKGGMGAAAPRPDPGVTVGQPFPKGTAGSGSFRIPGLITLRDGTLLATADARWNTTYDGGGLDTIVSRSRDNGANWAYSFANYLGDNGDRYNGSGSTCFIDPAAAVACDPATGRETVYLLADLSPYGVALNGKGNLWPVRETGFDPQGRLLLSDEPYGTETLGDSRKYNYSYYLDGDTIRSVADGSPVAGLAVDGHFNVTGICRGGRVESNLFFKTSPFKVQRTSYLYLVTSTDGGAHWSAPALLPLKRETERACLVSPSRGVVTGRGEIVFPCYSYDHTGTAQPQEMGFLFSSNGRDWARSAPAPRPPAWPEAGDSESAVVALSDGRLRFFARNNYSRCLSYHDFISGKGGLCDGRWLPRVDTPVVTNSNCQIAAVKYSRTSRGREVILISCPTGPEGKGALGTGGRERRNGVILAARVQDDAQRSMEWIDGARICLGAPESPFMYSALTELTRDGGGAKAGDIAILYEMKDTGWGEGHICQMRFETKALQGIDLDPPA